MNNEECETTVRLSLERYKKLEELEHAIKNGKPIFYNEREVDPFIYDFGGSIYIGEDAIEEIKYWLMDEINYYVKMYYKEDNPSLIRRILNKLKEESYKIRGFFNETD